MTLLALMATRILMTFLALMTLLALMATRTLMTLLASMTLLARHPAL